MTPDSSLTYEGPRAATRPSVLTAIIQEIATFVDKNASYKLTIFGVYSNTEELFFIVSTSQDDLLTFPVKCNVWKVNKPFEIKLT